MEIFNLKDQIPEEKAAHKDTPAEKNGIFDEKLTITDMKQGVKNPNRVNVFINKMYAFSLDVAQVVDFKLKIGKTVSEDELVEYKKASEFGKAYQRALEWVLMRPRSVRELRDYLRRREMQNEAKERKKEWDRDREIAELIAKGEDVDAEKLRKRAERTKAKKMKQEKYDFKDLIAERLVERGYVNDRKFAEFWVENRFVKKGVSRRRLEQELMKKGIDKSIVVEVLSGSERSDEAEIRKMIVKKRGKYDDEKLVAYLCRQGFSYDLVKRLLEETSD